MRWNTAHGALTVAHYRIAPCRNFVLQPRAGAQHNLNSDAELGDGVL